MESDCTFKVGLRSWMIYIISWVQLKQYKCLFSVLFYKQSLCLDNETLESFDFNIVTEAYQLTFNQSESKWKNKTFNLLSMKKKCIYYSHLLTWKRLQNILFYSRYFWETLRPFPPKDIGHEVIKAVYFNSLQCIWT